MKRKKNNQSKLIELFNDMLLSAHDEAYKAQEMIPQPPTEPIDSSNYIDLNNKWNNRVYKYTEKKLIPLDMRESAIYARAEQELNFDNFKKLLRRRKLTLSKATNRIELYRAYKAALANSLEEIHIQPAALTCRAEAQQITPRYKIPAGDPNGAAFLYGNKILIEYTQESELPKQLNRALTRHNFYKGVIDRIEKDIDQAIKQQTRKGGRK